MLSYSSKSADSFVSQRLVTEGLKENMHATGDGCVELTWCTETDTKNIYQAKFRISSEYDPPYDVVLGDQDATQLGL